MKTVAFFSQIYGEKFGPEINTTSSDEGNEGTRRGRRSRKSSEHSTDRYTQYETNNFNMQSDSSKLENMGKFESIKNRWIITEKIKPYLILKIIAAYLILRSSEFAIVMSEIDQFFLPFDSVSCKYIIVWIKNQDDGTWTYFFLLKFNVS